MLPNAWVLPGSGNCVPDVVGTSLGNLIPDLSQQQHERRGARIKVRNVQGRARILARMPETRDQNCGRRCVEQALSQTSITLLLHSQRRRLLTFRQKAFMRGTQMPHQQYLHFRSIRARTRKCRNVLINRLYFAEIEIG